MNPRTLENDPAGAVRRARLPPVKIEIEGDGTGRSAGIAQRKSTTRVAVVIPCFNRPRDAQLLLADLARADAHLASANPGVELRVVLVDNCSAPPLSRAHIPPGLNAELLTLGTNLGGSGGYNTGIARALGEDSSPEGPAWLGWGAHYLWLIDSDARVRHDTLSALLAAMEADSSVVVAGAALHDIRTGRCFELAGRVDRRNGTFPPIVPGVVGVRAVVEGDYVAAACALARADVVRRCGGMPDRFLNGDDVEWCVRLRQKSGGRIIGVPGATCRHPRSDKFPTFQRFYITRNSLAPIRALGLSRRVRFARATLDVLRAVIQEMSNRPDLARLHLLGLREAGLPDPTGAAAPGVLRVAPSRPLDELGLAVGELCSRQGARTLQILPGTWVSAADRAGLERRLAGIDCKRVAPPPPERGRVAPMIGLIARILLRPATDIAIVPARGRPSNWCRARWVVQIAGDSFVVRRVAPVRCTARALRALLGGAWLAWRASRSPGEGPTALDTGVAACLVDRRLRDSTQLEAVVLSHNRWPALERTLSALTSEPIFAGGEPSRPRAHRITVIDNASADGTPERLGDRFPGVRVTALPENIGVDAFNLAVLESTADAVLILDDDAIPDEHTIAIALDRLARNPHLGAVALHPLHARTGRSEWPFARALKGHSTDRWPVLGCANLVRRSAWAAVHGYERGYFLYRNDTDLALALLGAGWGVHFDPALTVRHDTPAQRGVPKSNRWHMLATRNWIWAARRHGRGVWRPIGALLGWAHAHALAGARPSAHAATLRGAIAGLSRRCPPLRSPTTGAPWASLIWMRLTGRSPGHR